MNKTGLNIGEPERWYRDEMLQIANPASIQDTACGATFLALPGEVRALLAWPKVRKEKKKNVRYKDFSHLILVQTFHSDLEERTLRDQA